VVIVHGLDELEPGARSGEGEGGMKYSELLESKRPRALDCGFEPGEVSALLYPFQQESVAWAVRKGRAAMFEDCGLGKTAQQLEWARIVSQKTDRPVLICAPLAVAEQTQREGEKFAIPVALCRKGCDVRHGVNITNYEMLHHFTPDQFGGIVLDESGILKSYSGSTRLFITDFAQGIQYRLACTATPAPNDWIELINHAEFLGVMKGKEILATYFIQDGNTTHAWKLKGHARHDFWAWVASWAVAIRKPSDVGFDDAGFVLPAMRVYQHTVSGHIAEDFLFPIEAQTLSERRHARKESMVERVEKAAAIANSTTDPFLVWCDLNAESAALVAAIPGAVEVKGSDSPEQKTERMTGFSDGRYRVLVTKPSICGWGMNWQHCNQMAFVGLSDSFEQLYQAIRRCWRFGQQKPVDVHLICAETEGAVIANVRRKEAEHAEMMEQIIRHRDRNFTLGKTNEMGYENIHKMELPSWIERPLNEAV
jgi:hypothetical protein